MLRIRPEQLAVLEEARLRQFEQDIVAHVRQFFPHECASAGAQTVRECVRFGIGRARAYGFTGSREITKYVSLMFTFGRDFDLDPELAWAASILRGDQPLEQKMLRLYSIGIDRASDGRGLLHQLEE
jgi:hypothetical protein